MRKVLTLILLGAIFVAGSAFAADPVIGTWTLNVAKSKFNPGPGPKAITRVYTESGGLYTLDQKTTGADGKDTALQLHYRKGKGELQEGNPDVDSVTATRIDANTWDFKLKKGGKVVGNVHRVIQHHGKSMIVHNTGKRDGAKYDDVLLFDRQ
jgi:hypothetical protein